jgi:hypothetical protein
MSLLLEEAKVVELCLAQQFATLQCILSNVYLSHSPLH